MSALRNIPPHAVLPLSAYDLEDLRKGAERFDQSWLQADLSVVGDKDGVLGAIANGFVLPAHFGHNLDALYDCLTNLKPDQSAEQPGFVIVLRELPDSEVFGAPERKALLDVFREAADYFYDRGTAFRVFYSVAKAP